MERQTSHKRTSLWREREKKKGSFSLIKKPDRVGVGSHTVTLKVFAGNSQNTPKLQIHEIFLLHVIIGEG